MFVYDCVRYGQQCPQTHFFQNPQKQSFKGICASLHADTHVSVQPVFCVLSGHAENKKHSSTICWFCQADFRPALLKLQRGHHRPTLTREKKLC